MARQIDRKILKEYQDCLVVLIEKEQDPEVVLEKLKADPRFSELHEYIDSIDSDMLAVAAELLGKWGRKSV